jgi:hypothetical protein
MTPCSLVRESTPQSNGANLTAPDGETIDGCGAVCGMRIGKGNGAA